MSSRAAVPREDTSRLVGGPSGVQQQLTPEAAEKKGTPEPAPLGAVVGEHWRARSVLGTLPDGQKTGLWRTLNQVSSHVMPEMVMRQPNEERVCSVYSTD